MTYILGRPSSSMRRFVLQRMLRVLTLPLRVARNPAAVYENANTEAILVVLMHKISQAAAADGLQDARALLRTWLTNLCAKHNMARAVSDGQALQSIDQVKYYQMPI